MGAIKMNSLQYLRALIALSFSLYFSPMGAQPADSDADILGKWRIVKHVSPTGATSSLTERDVRRLIGQPMSVSAELFEFNNHQCARPDYRRNVEDTVDYFYREWRVNSDEMPIGARITVVENRCGNNVLYPTNKDHLIVSEDGFFFEAVRVGSNAAATPESTSTSERKGANADIFGTWTIDGADWQGSGKDSEATKKSRAAIYMGMPVYISARRFFYNENQCKNPTYKRSRQQKTVYFHGDWRAAKGRLPFLQNMLTVVETNCGTIYPINRKLILIEDRSGMFFSAVPLLQDERDNTHGLSAR
ncbi:hypothetical protein GTP81_23555 [Rugamonas sp. FT107W]|uniref:Lipocalin-like domain-containing protein n=1 Tax=Duganella vulcania TaxID=2692166 RepID=A0A845HQE6_9BURK|nr:hypothetical protein [Duganella vulcania]MYN19725.1 hypothetical protein [Duganella vulcania]